MDPNNMNAAGMPNTPNQPVDSAQSVASTGAQAVEQALAEANMEVASPAGVPMGAPVKKSGKGMLFGMIIFMILAIGGIGFGVYMMMDGNTQKANLEKQISDLRAQNNKLLDQLAEGGSSDNEGDSDSTSAVDPEDYIYVGEWGVKIKIPENLIGKIGYIFSGNNYLDVTDYASNYTYGEQMDWVKSNVLKIVRSKSGEVDFENCHQSCAKLITTLDGYDYSYVLSGSNIELLQSTALNDMVKPDSFSRI